MLPPVPELDKDHNYTYQGIGFPSVTQILAAVGLVNYQAIPAAVRDAAMERGKYAHSACELDDKGELDEEKLDPRLEPYLHAWRAFKSDHKPEILPEMIERRGVSLALGYAGTVDRVIRMGGTEATLDLKTGALQRWTGIQIVAYDLLMGFDRRPGIGLELRKDGTYRMVNYSDPDDFAVWMACLKVFKFSKGAK